MSDTAQKLDPNTRAMFTAAYRFLEQNHNMPDTEQAWDHAANELGDIARSFHDHPLSLSLLVACYNEVERRVLQERQAQNIE